MTWGDFKKIVEESGASDETEIDYIDISSTTMRMEAYCDNEENTLAVH